MMRFKASKQLLNPNNISSGRKKGDTLNPNNPNSLPADFIDKTATQQVEFLQHYPKYDGRGVTMAIIDDSVDFSLTGLFKTSMGFRKVIECYDFSGDADTVTDVIKEPNENGIIESLTGRALKIPSTWENPSRQYHLGTKNFSELCHKTTLNNLQEFVHENLSQQILDVLVWHDGKKWHGCIDTSFNGNFEKVDVLTSYQDNQDFGYVYDDIPYCLNIGDNGNFTEIITPKMDHGSCVALIAAGNYGPDSENNGLAPGALIVSINVMGGRNKDSVERALLKCDELKVDIVIISFEIKEHHFQMIKNIVKENARILFFYALGNDGPLIHSAWNLEKVCENEMLIIVSVTTQTLKRNLYDVISYQIPTVPSHSSRGPNKLIQRIVSLVAPGEARISAPKWYSLKKQMVYGTSYATPNAAGAIACLLSGLKDKSIQASVSELRLALFNTALLPHTDSKLDYGNGIPQILKAFDLLQSSSSEGNFVDPVYEVNNEGKKGIYITERMEIPKTYTVTLQRTQHDTQLLLEIVPENARNFIQYPTNVDNDAIELTVDTTDLSSGCYYSEIVGTQLANIYKSYHFYIPVLIIIPETLSTGTTEKRMDLQPGMPYRIFFDMDEQHSGVIINFISLQQKFCEIFVYDFRGPKERQSLDFNKKNRLRRLCFDFPQQKLNEICIYVEGEEAASFKLEMGYKKS